MVTGISGERSVHEELATDSQLAVDDQRVLQLIRQYRLLAKLQYDTNHAVDNRCNNSNGGPTEISSSSADTTTDCASDYNNFSSQVSDRLDTMLAK